MLTPRQKQIKDFVDKTISRKEIAPTEREIARRFRISPSTAHEHLATLQNKGYLEKTPGQARGIKISKSEKLVSIPLLGTIAAGEPIEAVMNPESIAVPKSNLPVDTKNIYALKVAGDSMIDDNINDGDTILVKQQSTAENGQKVITLINNNEATLKKFYNEKGHIRLQPANKNIEPILINVGTDLAIQGTVIDVIKNNPFLPVVAFPSQKEEVKKYHKLPLNQIICGDALKELKKFPDKSIDLILTDPPYGLNKTGITNDNDLSVFYSSLSDSYRILKDNSFYITFFSTKFLPKIFINNPFDYFWNFILYCPNGQVGSPIGYSKYMSCTVFKKGQPKIIKRNKDIFVDTPSRMVEPDEGFIDHPTPKPKTFIADILKMFSDEKDIVLDPFIGSGSTAMACKLTNRKYIGIELDKKYYRLAEKRLKKFKHNLDLLSN